MRLEEYTSDAICRAIGLTGFIEPDIPSPSLRVVLKPAFEPEVCITLASLSGRSQLSVVALRDMLWRQPIPIRLTEYQETVTVSGVDFDRASEGFATALADIDSSSERRVCLDGMSVECCLLSDDDVRRFAEHASRPTVSAFISRLVWLAWVACQRPTVRNALAACGRYMGVDYPLQQGPTALPTTQLLVLGTPETRADFFDQLRFVGGWSEARRRNN